MRFVQKSSLLMLAVILFASILIPVFGLNAYAAQGESDAVKYSIELVVDKSTSLNASDRPGYRYSALSYLLTTLPATGNEVGALTFTKAVNEVAKIAPINSQGDKDDLISKIRDEGTVANGTDVGLAFAEGVDKLVERKEQQKENGEEVTKPVLILFSDGLSEYLNPTESGRSSRERDEAVELAKKHEIIVLVVFLNAGGNKDGQDIFDMVRDARNRADDPTTPYNEDGSFNDLGKQYTEIREDKDIIGSFSEMVHFLTGQGELADPRTIPMKETCTIPGIGVAELNLAIRYEIGVLDKINIMVTAPDGSVIDENSKTNKITVVREEVFFNAKIVEPMEGEWTISVEPKEGATGSEKVEVTPDIIISTDVSAGIECLNDGVIRYGDSATLSAFLEQAGESVTDSKKYSYYKCILTIINPESGERTEKEISINDEGQFLLEDPIIDYKPRNAFVTFTCDYVSFSSETVSYRAVNQSPKVESPINVTCVGNIFVKSFSDYLPNRVTDPEGGQLQFELKSNQGVASIDENGYLEITLGKESPITLSIDAIDEECERTTFEYVLTVEDNTPIILVLIIGGPLLLILIIAYLIMRVFGGKINAKVILTISATSDASITEYMYGQSLEVALSSCGKTCVTLYDALTKSLRAVTSDSVKDAIMRLISRNENRLRRVVFKKKPGFDNSAFLMYDGETGEPPILRTKTDEFFTSITLEKDIEVDATFQPRISIKCQARRASSGSGRNDFD